MREKLNDFVGKIRGHKSIKNLEVKLKLNAKALGVWGGRGGLILLKNILSKIQNYGVKDLLLGSTFLYF